MKISELASKTQISTHRLRRYETSGLIKSTRSANGYREFSESVVREVVFICMARECGFSINFIAEYLPRYRAGTLTAKEMIEAIRQRIKEVNEAINTQLDLRKKLEDHIEWFNSKARKAK
jgi:MerR family transcriptional regulator, copper efflux regulator